MNETTHISSTVKWLIGISLTVIMAVSSYSISKNLENENRITTLEIELKQIRAETTDLWNKYNTGLITKSILVERLIIIEQKVSALEKHLEELR